MASRVISKTQMIQQTRENANKLCLRERSSGVWLEEELRMDLRIVLEHLQIEKRRRHNSKRCFLPALGKFIQIQDEQMRSLTFQRSRMIVQLLCIALLRIKYRMYGAALLILLYVGIMLQSTQTYQYSFRRVVYALIGRVRALQQNQRVKEPGQMVPKRRNVKSFRNAAMCPLKYNIFRQRFEAKLRKSQLIVEKTFDDLLRDEKDQSMVKLPEQVHPSMYSYRQITVNIDRKSLIFSYEYPRLLQGKVCIQDYRFFISKLNEVVVPEARNFNQNSIIRIFYLPLLIILFCFLLAGLITTHQACSPTIPLCILILLIIILSVKIYTMEKFYKNPLSISKSLKKIIDNMSSKYWNKKVVFSLGDSIQCFIIYIEMNETTQVSSSSSSESSVDSSQQDNPSFQSFFNTQKRKSRVSILRMPDFEQFDPIQEERCSQVATPLTPDHQTFTNTQNNELFEEQQANQPQPMFQYIN